MDELTLNRLLRAIAGHKKAHGRDISESELLRQGFAAAAIDRLVRRGLVDKYQVTTGQGSRENRFKVHRDWRSLRTGD